MYAFTIRVSGDLAQVEQRVVAALAGQKFGIINEIDVQATLKKKMDLDRPPYKILGACNPGLANQAINIDPDIGALLPCNVLIRADGEDGCVVAFMDPVAVLGLSEQDEVKTLAEQVRELLLKVRDELA